ncbi:hypothetical protein B0T18DRAFT_387955 [Schizothecium vesticola]|uniref:Uncharacterized protein n=1 Tax=Schizothecium vesticola TaxID=314040 RepID=A0AA40F6I1_9PEZI|nr:hypothetical protein B0T18DRAFT_387955 [Schizothecium vesticola]
MPFGNLTPTHSLLSSDDSLSSDIHMRTLLGGGPWHGRSLITQNRLAEEWLLDRELTVYGPVHSRNLPVNRALVALRRDGEDQDVNLSKLAEPLDLLPFVAMDSAGWTWMTSGSVSREMKDAFDFIQHQGVCYAPVVVADDINDSDTMDLSTNQDISPSAPTASLPPIAATLDKPTSFDLDFCTIFPFHNSEILTVSYDFLTDTLRHAVDSATLASYLASQRVDALVVSDFNEYKVKLANGRKGTWSMVNVSLFPKKAWLV